MQGYEKYWKKKKYDWLVRYVIAITAGLVIGAIGKM